MTVESYCPTLYVEIVSSDAVGLGLDVDSDPPGQ